MAWTPPPTFATTSGISPGTLNTYVRDNLKSLRNGNDGVINCYRAANLSLPSASAFVEIPWTQHDVLAGSSAFHSTASGAKLVAPSPGYYRLTGSMIFNSASAAVDVLWQRNGAGTRTTLRSAFYGSAQPRALPFTDTVQMASGDYITVQVIYDSVIASSATVIGGTTGSRCVWEFLGATT